MEKTHTPFAFRTGDGDDGTRIHSRVWVRNDLLDQLHLIAQAMEINRYIVGTTNRRFLMDTEPQVDDDGTVAWCEGPGGATAFGASWRISEPQQIPAGDLPDYSPSEIRDLKDTLDRGTKRWLSYRGIVL